MNILNFLKNRKLQEQEEKDEIDKGIELYQKRDLSYAQAAHEFLEYAWKGDSKEVLDKLFKLGEKITNSFDQQGLAFKDGSVLLKTRTEYKGLNLKNSDSWKKGLGFEEFSVIKYEIGHPITLRSGTSFEVVNFEINKETPITLNIKGFGQLNYYNDGIANELEESGYDLMCLPKTINLFDDEQKLNNKQKLK